MKKAFVVEARGATLRYLPAYSPDKVKHLLRSAAARSNNRLWTILGECRQRFSPAECAKCQRHYGYGHPV